MNSYNAQPKFDGHTHTVDGSSHMNSYNAQPKFDGHTHTVDGSFSTSLASLSTMNVESD